MATRGHELPWMMMISWGFFGFEKRGQLQRFLSHWIYLILVFVSFFPAEDVMVFVLLWDLGGVLVGACNKFDQKGSI